MGGINNNASDSVMKNFVPSAAIFQSLRTNRRGCLTHCLIEVVPVDGHEFEAALSSVQPS